MINYYVPGFVEAQTAYRILFWLRDNAPRCFYPNVKISKIYGSFPNMIWNGGTMWIGPSLTLAQIIDYFEWYKTQNIKLQLVCTNPVLQPTDVYDRYCNAILDVASNYDFVEVLVSSDILEDYIRNRHPHMKIDKSIIATTGLLGTEQDSIEGYLQMLDRYNICVLPRKYSKDIDFLTQIPEDKRNRFEILVNDPCPVNCPRAYCHYQEMARLQLWETCEPAICTAMPIDTPFRGWMYRQHQCNYKEVCELQEPLGFTEIKVSGRTDIIPVIINIVPYLIQPEFQRDIYSALLSCFQKTFVPPEFS